jgi:hypothetical protein
MRVIVEQKWGWIEADGKPVVSEERTVELDGRDISAEIALYDFLDKNDGVGRALIKEVVDADGTHQPGAPVAGGKAATSIKFAVEAMNAVAMGRYVINFWGDAQPASEGQ